MARVKRGVRANKRRKNVLKLAKGFQGGRSKKFRAAKQAILKAGSYKYRDRKVRKRDFRQLWITRLNAAVREHGMSYSVFINALKKKNSELDRKVLAQIAFEHPETMKSIVEEVK